MPLKIGRPFVADVSAAGNCKMLLWHHRSRRCNNLHRHHRPQDPDRPSTTQLKSSTVEDRSVSCGRCVCKLQPRATPPALHQKASQPQVQQPTQTLTDRPSTTQLKSSTVEDRSAACGRCVCQWQPQATPPALHQEARQPASRHQRQEHPAICTNG